MTSYLTEKLASDAHRIASLGCTNGPKDYDDVFDELFTANISESMSNAEQVALYPQFRRAIEPVLLRLMRSWNEVGVVGGYWVRVEGTAVLEEARANNALTVEELGLLERAERREP